MKHFIVACIALTVFAKTSTAQYDEEEMLPKNNEISASYGFVTTAQILDAFLAITINAGSLGNVNTNTTSYTGGLYLTYRRKILEDKLGLGIALGLDQIKGDFTNEAGTKKGTFRSRDYTIAAEAQVAYMNRPNVRLYGLVGAGFSLFKYQFTTTGIIEKEKLGITHPNFQVTPIGAAFGNQFGGFIELGLGYKGLVNLGVYAKL